MTLTLPDTANDCLRCCLPLLLKAEALLSKEASSLDAVFINTVQQQFNYLTKRLTILQVSVEAQNDIKYALAALIDELVAYSEVKFKSAWLMQPLQLQFFGEYSAGEGFYNKLALLQQDPSKNIKLLEIYWLVMQLGFKGIYQLRGTEKWLALQISLRDQIKTVRGDLPAIATNSAAAAVKKTSIIPWEIPTKNILLIVMLLLLIIYLSYYFLMSYQVESVLSHWQNITNLS